jgi:hypothetical protein
MAHALRSAALALGLLAAPGLAMAEEGMWTFDNFPAQAVRDRHGVTINQRWLDHVRGAALRLSVGCSASVVSPQGLVMTNHHCVSDCVQDLSTPENDLLRSGVLTTDRRQERACPGLQAERLESITDVTGQVADAVVGQTGAAFVAARAAATARLEADACAGRSDTHLCEVTSLYQGGRYSLHVFRRYSDVRLVFAPEVQTAFFGGDPDNFNFPRYDLDVAFLRLYENGRVVDTPGHLRWSAAAPREGEAVFVPGNPGTTNRLMTTAQLKALRDAVLPQTLMQFSELRGRLIQFSAGSEENARIASRDLFGIENSFKVYAGQLAALNAPGFLDARQAEEDALRARVAADPALAGRTGDPWRELQALQADRIAIGLRHSLLEQRGGYYSQLYTYARTLVRGAAERARPNGERLPEFSDSRLDQTARTLLDARPAHPQVDEIQLAFWLAKVREYLTADAPEVSALLGQESPESLAATLVRSGLGDARLRRRLWEGGMDAVESSDDPMIRFVIATDAMARAARRDYETRVTGPAGQATEKIARARFDLLGTSVYPDATFTPRLSWGSVAGWTHQGRTVGPFTTFRGLWTRATGKPPYDLAPRWIAAKDRLNPDTVFNIASSNDIIGGNSGSPLINARAEVVGVVFDGNIHSLGGAFAYDGAINRSVSTSSASITEALRTVYGLDGLVAELLGS